MNKFNSKEDLSEEDVALDFYARLLIRAALNKIREERLNSQNPTQDQVSS